MGLGRLPQLLIQTGSGLTALRPRILKIGSNLALADNADGTATLSATAAGLEVKEADGSPDVSGVTTIVVSNGTLTDDGGGSVTITTGGGGGGAATSETLTVYNGTGSTLTKGTAVWNGGDADVTNEVIKVTVATKAAGGSANPILGLVTADITNGTTGTVITFGSLTGLDTHTFAVGDYVMVDTASPVIGLNLVPYISYDPTIYRHLVAIVTKSHASTGSVFVDLIEFSPEAHTHTGAGEGGTLSGFAPTASPTFSGTATAPEFAASGLTGATAASGYVGATASGAPVSGTFVQGNWIAAQDGKRWTCTVGGTPGTWVQEPGTGGSGALTLISDNLLVGSAASVTFSAIAGTYKHLRIQGDARGDTAATTIDLWVRFNGDSGGNYDWLTAGSGGAADTAMKLGRITAASVTAGVASPFTLDIHDYAGTTFQKSVLHRVGVKVGTTLGSLADDTGSAYWRNTAAITSVTLLASSGNFITGSRFSLYGLS